MISRTILIALEPFGEELPAARAAAALGRGIQAGAAAWEVDLCPFDAHDRDLASLKQHLSGIDFDVRMRAARALVVGAGLLDEATLLGSVTFELATRARQTGVPVYAVAGSNRLSLLDARILDLQVVLQARDTRALRRAGERLAALF